MKILQVCNKPPYPPRDGGSLAMFNLAYALGRIGHTVHVLTIVTQKHPLTRENYELFNRIMPVQTITINTHINPVWLLTNLLFSHQPYLATRFISENFRQKLVDKLESEHYDIVQLEGLFMTPYIPDIRQHSQAIIVFRAHNIEHEIWQRIAEEERNYFRKVYFTILAKRIRNFEIGQINRYDLLIPITDRDCKRFVHMGNTKPALTCKAGIDADMKPVLLSGPSKKSCSLFFLGSLDWIPNQEGLLWFVEEVFPILYRHDNNVKLHVAGRNAPDKLIRKIAHPGIHYHGEVANSREFMKSYSILVAPCFSGSGMRVKIIEAMSLGKPVITTPIGAEGIDAEHDSTIIIAKDADNFCQHIERLIDNPDLYRRISENARHFVASCFNNTVIASALSQFYQNHLT